MRSSEHRSKANRTRRRRRLGFSILEAMIAAGVLGVGLVALVKLHQSAMRGMKSSREAGIALDIATQAAEEMSTLTALNLAAQCPGAGGCKLGSLPLELQYAAPQACTTWTFDGLMPDEAGVPPAGQATEAAAAAARLTFRVDRVVSAHPIAANNPNTLLVQVFVCWRDEAGYVRQVATERIAVN
jgi:type II secretory pathway pseudopilin PulG